MSAHFHPFFHVDILHGEQFPLENYALGSPLRPFSLCHKAKNTRLEMCTRGFSFSFALLDNIFFLPFGICDCWVGTVIGVGSNVHRGEKTYHIDLWVKFCIWYKREEEGQASIFEV